MRRKSGHNAPPGYAELICELQQKLGFKRDQAGFANRIKPGLAQGTLSSWARGLRRPSALMFLQMGSIAPDPDLAIKLYEQAGLDKEGIIRAAKTAWGQKFEPPKEAEVVRVGPLPGTEDRGRIIVRRKIIPDPSHAHYLVLGKSAGFGPPDPRIAVLDVRYRGAKLAPFWNRLVVARGAAEWAFYVGYLLNRQKQNLRDALEQKYTRFAVISPTHYTTEPTLEVGIWRPSFLDGKDFPREIEGFSQEQLLGLLSEVEEGSRQMDAYEGLEILGRVVDLQEDEAS